MITRYFPLTLTLDAPALLTQFEDDASSSRTLDFIPGASLRGAVARGLCEQGLDRTRPDLFRRIVLGGHVRYLNGYIVAAGRRCLPTPASFRREKYHGRDRDDQRHDLSAGWPEDDAPQLERFDELFLTLDTADQRPGNLSVSARFHHQRDRSVGRATKEVGAIFQFQSLDAGQSFRALVAISADDEQKVEALRTHIAAALEGGLFLGRSRRAGYGGTARVSWEPPEEREASGGCTLASDVPAGTTFRALAVSDFLGRNVAGQCDPASFESALALPLAGLAEVVDRFFEFRRVGGFNRTWGLELPQALALRAGSLVLLNAVQAVPLSAFLNIEHAGVGERRAEGFGRVLFLDSPTPRVKLQETTTTHAQRPLGGAPELIVEMQQRLLADAMERALAESAATLARDAGERLPSPSLLSKLRLPLRHHANHADALRELARWLDADARERLKNTARRQLEDCRVRPPRARPISLLDWLAVVVDIQSPTFDVTSLVNCRGLAQRLHFVPRDDSTDPALTWLVAAEQQPRWRVVLLDAFLATLIRRVKLREQEAAHADTE